MNMILSMVGKLLGWILFVAVFASIGLATDNPSVMVPAYGISIIIIIGAILYALTRKKRQSVEDAKTPTFIPWIEGIFLGLFSLIVPAFMTSNNGALYYLNIPMGVTIFSTIIKFFFCYSFLNFAE